MRLRVFWSVVVVCVFLPGESQAQDTGPLGIFHNYGYPHGPRVAPSWSYPGIPNGPFVTYPTPPVYPGVFGYGLVPHSGTGTTRPNGVSLCGPPVPVYGPTPATLGNDPLVKQWRGTIAPRSVWYGWVGPYSALPRPKYVSVHAWPGQGNANSGPTASAPAANAGNGCLTLSVKVPQSAEVRVDGRPTVQTGTDRTFESPPLEAGKSYSYTVTARWLDRGQPVEVSKVVTGGPGEVVLVDFGTPVIAAGK